MPRPRPARGSGGSCRHPDTMPRSRGRPLLRPSSGRSTSTDTSESESRKNFRESFDENIPSTEDSNYTLATVKEGNDVTTASSTIPTTGTGRKKKQKPKMLKKDIEATKLLTHEFDDMPVVATESKQMAPITQAKV